MYRNVLHRLIDFRIEREKNKPCVHRRDTYSTYKRDLDVENYECEREFTIISTVSITLNSLFVQLKTDNNDKFINQNVQTNTVISSAC